MKSITQRNLVLLFSLIILLASCRKGVLRRTEIQLVHYDTGILLTIPLEGIGSTSCLIDIENNGSDDYQVILETNPDSAVTYNIQVIPQTEKYSVAIGDECNEVLIVEADSKINGKLNWSSSASIFDEGVSGKASCSFPVATDSELFLAIRLTEDKNSNYGRVKMIYKSNDGDLTLEILELGLNLAENKKIKAGEI
ncbi:MAG: hypothetical protein JKY53_02765 [Flavobacteriales bacterium]|nr:hypothetical protein [Flavobacteriales bacterium]